MNYTNKLKKERALKKIKTAYIFAFISAGITLAFAFFDNMFFIIDAIVVVVLAFLLMKKQSRIAAVILLVYYLLPRILDPSILANGSIALVVIITWAYIEGIIGTFSYNKLKEQNNFCSNCGLENTADVTCSCDEKNI